MATLPPEREKQTLWGGHCGLWDPSSPADPLFLPRSLNHQQGAGCGLVSCCGIPITFLRDPSCPCFSKYPKNVGATLA